MGGKFLLTKGMRREANSLITFFAKNANSVGFLPNEIVHLSDSTQEIQNLNVVEQDLESWERVKRKKKRKTRIKIRLVILGSDFIVDIAANDDPKFKIISK